MELPERYRSDFARHAHRAHPVESEQPVELRHGNVLIRTRKPGFWAGPELPEPQTYGDALNLMLASTRGAIGVAEARYPLGTLGNAMSRLQQAKTSYAEVAAAYQANRTPELWEAVQRAEVERDAAEKAISEAKAADRKRGYAMKEAREPLLNFLKDVAEDFHIYLEEEFGCGEDH